MPKNIPPTVYFNMLQEEGGDRVRFTVDFALHGVLPTEERIPKLIDTAFENLSINNSEKIEYESNENGDYIDYIMAVKSDMTVREFEDIILDALNKVAKANPDIRLIKLVINDAGGLVVTPQQSGNQKLSSVHALSVRKHDGEKPTIIGTRPRGFTM